MQHLSEIQLHMQVKKSYTFLSTSTSDNDKIFKK